MWPPTYFAEEFQFASSSAATPRSELMRRRMSLIRISGCLAIYKCDLNFSRLNSLRRRSYAATEFKIIILVSRRRRLKEPVAFTTSFLGGEVVNFTRRDEKRDNLILGLGTCIAEDLLIKLYEKNTELNKIVTRC